jgi:hypothetical protein
MYLQQRFPLVPRKIIVAPVKSLEALILVAWQGWRESTYLLEMVFSPWINHKILYTRVARWFVFKPNLGKF